MPYDLDTLCSFHDWRRHPACDTRCISGDDEEEDSDGELAGNRRSGKKSTKKAAQDLLQDDRFTALFPDPRYQVDMDDPEYKALQLIKRKQQNDTNKDKHSASR